MISTRGRYALRVLIDIAENSNGNYITLNDIASRQSISEKYLESILVLLTRGNLLNGLRGKGGGYKLTKAPEEYTMKSILVLTEGTLAPVACLKDGAEPCLKASSCKTLPIWQGLNKAISDYLESVTLADIIERPDNYSI